MTTLIQNYHSESFLEYQTKNCDKKIENLLGVHCKDSDALTEIILSPEFIIFLPT